MKRRFRIFKRFERMAPLEIALHLFVSAIFLLLSLSYMYILVWAIFAGFKTNTTIVMEPFKLPREWNWENYINVFSLLRVQDNNFIDMILNSIWFVVGGTLLHHLSTCAFAYTCSKYKFPGSSWVYPIILVMITLPIYGNGGAAYRLYRSLGFVNSYSQILTALGGFNAFFLYYTAYFKNLSWTYAEAAMMDGANDFMIYLRVYFPMAKPIFGALFLTNWVTNWNAYESQLLYQPQIPTLPVGIYQFSLEMSQQARMDILFAACVWASIPAIVLYTVFNKAITTNVSLGGIKG